MSTDWVESPRLRGQPEPRGYGVKVSRHHLHIWRKTWALFVGFNDELACWQFRVSWGGKSTVRGVNGLYAYRRQIDATLYGWRPVIRYSRNALRLEVAA